MHDFDSYLGHLSDHRYTVNVFNLVHDDSGLGHHDGAFFVVNFLYPVGFLHGSHLRIPLDDLDPGLEFLRLQPYFYPRLDCMIRLAKTSPPSNPQHPYFHHVSSFITPHGSYSVSLRNVDGSTDESGTSNIIPDFENRRHDDQ